MSNEEKPLSELPAGREADMVELHKIWIQSRKEWATDFASVFDRYGHLVEMRIAFFEKLILLAGGSFSLSLTFLGFWLREQGPPHRFVNISYLIAAWALMLGCIVFAWRHNLTQYRALEKLAASSVAWSAGLRTEVALRLMRAFEYLSSGTDFAKIKFNDLVSLFAAQFAGDKTDQARDRLMKDWDAFSSAAHRWGNLALMSMLLSLFFLIFFAVKNLP